MTEAGRDNAKGGARVKSGEISKRPAPQNTALPQKKYYRARAHSNPFSDSQYPVPLHPNAFDWSLHFPSFFPPPRPIEDGQDVPLPDAGDHPEASLERSSVDAAPSRGGRPSREEGLDHSAIRETPPEGGWGAHVLPSGERPLVRFADCGCGFGGLLVQLSPLFPETLMVGFELRDKVSEYVRERVQALRAQHSGQYGNITAIRTNTMKFLPNYFFKGQLTKMFFLFPDPHFKEKNHRRRIITTALLAEYAYVLAVGGLLYTITDVEELGLWHTQHLSTHPLFEEVSPAELEADPVVRLLATSSEEGLKVARNGGKTFRAVYRRIALKSLKEI
eukprot:TRINITY_DN3405_c0_g1_i2.p1 TRINITY_DN3405_c0_g1~~TRINITY_DN3405_c0_g1_i2.p1  ORF type:complete len:333 (+),score=50.30 TRINITY_DN3405_c0_g1_i2:134-1132(+)